MKDILEINEEQIMGYLSRLNLVADEKQIEFIKNLDTLDIHAVPGAGKTTMLGIKIACLLDNWKKLPNQNHGMCILSHTNTAKDEILKILKKLDHIEKIKNFPHFVGTIQEFVNKFGGIPYIKSQHWKLSRIVEESNLELLNKNVIKYKNFDINAFFKEVHNKKSKKKLNKNIYPISYFLETFNRKGKIKESDFCYTFNNGKLTLLKFEEIFSHIDDLYNYKNECCKRGLFYYKDFYAFFNEIIYNHPNLVRAISLRFPICFIDEYQDNTKTQDELLEKLFSKHSIFQRIGDPNQSIYDIENDNEENSFNQNSRHYLAGGLLPNLDMLSSYRFKGSNIENLLQIFSKNNIESNAVGVMGKDTVIKIIPINISYEKQNDRADNYGNELIDIKNKYIKIIKETFSDKVQDFNFDKDGQIKYFSIGASGKDKDKIHIQKYLDTYDKKKSEKNFRPKYWIDCFYLIEKKIKEKNDFKEYYDLIIDTLAKNSLLENIKTTSQLKNFLKSEDKLFKFNKILFELISLEKSEKLWKEKLNIIKDFINIDINKEYFKFKDSDIDDNDHINNIYEEDNIKIKFDTIHGIKGQTHNATLVLTTENDGFDIEKIIEKRNYKNDDKKFGKNNFKRIKNWYVAASRPKYLLCLAIPKSVIENKNFPENWKNFIYEEN
ncbi:MAG: UvrD-helicase domain-containing protein [Alphaproteobacteria bacterium]|jgi:hypothetical protein|nr:UvrD-helicase domain-containing protein [Alphaproteobacteria bacterium]